MDQKMQKNSKSIFIIFDNMSFFPSKVLSKNSRINYNPRILWGGEAPPKKCPKMTFFFIFNFDSGDQFLYNHWLKYTNKILKILRKKNRKNIILKILFLDFPIIKIAKITLKITLKIIFFSIFS